MKGKLSPRYVGPFDVMEKVGEVSYRVALPPQLSHVHNVFHVSVLRGYKYHPLHVVQYPLHKITEDLSCEEEAEAILAREERVLRKNTISFVKVLWKNHSEREATWELEESIREKYPHLFDSENISRRKVSLICVAALESSNACDKTFEVAIVLPRALKRNKEARPMIEKGERNSLIGICPTESFRARPKKRLKADDTGRRQHTGMYSIEELLHVAYLQERRGPWSETSRGMPGLKASSCSQWMSSLGMWGEIWGSLSGDKDASNIWGEPRLYLRPRTRETAGNGGLSLAREMPYP
ncbi:hypothetical protein AgCh_009897 [Apium graveolens]